MFKSILAIFVCLPFSILGQKYALFDTKLKMPIIYTDSVTVEQVRIGFFPLENISIDSLVANIEYLKSILDVRQRSKMESFELKSSNVTIRTSRVPQAFGDRYSSTIESECNGIISKHILIDSSLKNAKSSDKLEKLLLYFKANKSFFRSPKEIHPKIYNIVVITE